MSLYLSYRPEDTGEIAEHIARALEAQPVDSVSPGQSLREAIHEQVRQSSALLAVIGARWLTRPHGSEQRCLDDPDDAVRMELEAAFAHGTPVFAVLVGRATMPEPDALPPGLQSLSTCPVMTVREGTHSQTDITVLSELFEGLRRLLRHRDPGTPRDRYVCYVSRPMLEQLSVRAGKGAMSAAPGPGHREAPGPGFLSSLPRRFGIREPGPLDPPEPRPDMDTLSAVLEHWERHQKVLELEKAWQERQSLALDAFCYTFQGRFRCLGMLDRDAHGEVYRLYGEETPPPELFLPEESFRAHARRENAYPERGPNGASLVSDIGVLGCELPSFTLLLACPLKFFSEMGGTWHEAQGEWEVRPHGGNRHYFWRNVAAWLEGIIFIHGVTGRTLWGSPLCLVRPADPALWL